jgi:hypothetical protein
MIDLIWSILQKAKRNHGVTTIRLFASFANAARLTDLRAAGATSLDAIAAGLNEKGILTPRNGSRWMATQVGRLLWG